MKYMIGPMPTMVAFFALMAVLWGFVEFLLWRFPHDPPIVYDRELQKQAFESCMTMLPSGPKETRYNDWAEVVGQCRSYAREMSEVKND